MILGKAEPKLKYIYKNKKGDKDPRMERQPVFCYARI